MKLKPLNTLLFLVALAVFIYAFFIYDTKKPLRHLPIYGERELNSSDTVYHTIPFFSFINQDGKTVTQKILTEAFM